MEDDPIEKAIGRFGPYQTWILILLSIGRHPTEFQLTNVVFILPKTDYICADDSPDNTTNKCPCNSPIYDQSVFESSVSSTWGLICDRAWLATVAQSMLQVGILTGSIFFGYISDRYGRKLAVLIALSLQVVAVATSGAVPEFWMFLVCRFIIGVAVGGTMICVYVHLIELCGKSFRPYLLGFHELSYVLGYITLPAVAYFVRNWRTLQLVTSLPWIFVIAYCWLIPESPRWLVTTGKKTEAVTLLTKIARRNKMSTEAVEELVDKIEIQYRNNNQKHGSYVDLFKTPKMRIYTVLISIVWLLCAFTFFGVNQYIGRLQGNIYLNVMLSAVFLAPGLVLCVAGALYLQRRFTIIACFSTAAISLLALMLIHTFTPTSNNAILAFAIIGQIGAFSSFVIIYLYTSEIFPTVVRNSAIGCASVFARVGGFIAPFIVNINDDWISSLIFSLAAFIAMIICFYLPETKDIVLPNTVVQTELM